MGEMIEPYRHIPHDDAHDREAKELDKTQNGEDIQVAQVNNIIHHVIADNS